MHSHGVVDAPTDQPIGVHLPPSPRRVNQLPAWHAVSVAVSLPERPRLQLGPLDLPRTQAQEEHRGRRVVPDPHGQQRNDRIGQFRLRWQGRVGGRARLALTAPDCC